LIAGPDADEVGGYVIFEGVADIQTVEYQIVEWELITTTTVLGVTTTTITTGTVTGLQITDPDDIQALVNAGIPVGLLTVGTADLPVGATITNTTSDPVDIDTEFDAREIGVFVADRNE